jgi:hypothetical protein
MATQKLFLNLYLASGGEPVVFEFPGPTPNPALVSLCQQIRDAWASGQAIAIQNPAGSQYVNSNHVAMFSVS